MAEPSTQDAARIVIAGGGVAGFEAALALHDLAEERAELHLIDAEPELTLRPFSVEEPFSGRPAERYALGPAIEQLGGRFTLGRVEAVDPEARTIAVADESAPIGFDKLVVCLGARARPAFDPPALTVDADRTGIPIDSLIETAAAEGGELALLGPDAGSWPLPLYELALLARERSEELGMRDVAIGIHSPESTPLESFGPVPSAAVADLLETRRIGFEGGGPVRATGSTALALPELHGPALAGLPDGGDGFIPVDDQGRVTGHADIYAAGDGTTYPIKQGGIASQQADVVAAAIAAELGAPVEPRRLRPVLRGMLLTGGTSLYMLRDLADPADEGLITETCPWSPPEKIAGRYLVAWLRDLPVPDWDEGRG